MEEVEWRLEGWKGWGEGKRDGKGEVEVRGVDEVVEGG